VAQAAEVVAERWTPLILRELFLGSRRYNDIKRGVPLISPSLLSTRLRELETAGIVERHGKKGSVHYELTVAGQQLRPIIEALGLWGHHWLKREIKKDELDPGFLMWDIRRCVDPQMLFERDGEVIEFCLWGVPAKKRLWWLVFENGEVDLCLKDPRREVTLKVESPIRDLVEVWLGHKKLQAGVRAGVIKLAGKRSRIQAFKRGFGVSLFARLAQAHPPA
jgi:DNA-binding HxlR family transcriptional regulator